MAATYNDRLTNELDTIRWQLGDTDMSDALLSDEHITAVLALKGSVSAAVSTLAGELVRIFARQPVRASSNGKSVDYSDRLAVWRELVSNPSGAPAFSVAPPRADGYAIRAAAES